MKISFRFNLALVGLFLLTLLWLAGCGAAAGGAVAEATPQDVAEVSEEAQYLLGKWRVNNGRFGHKIFDFQADGRLLIEDVDNGQIIEMAYVFVGDNTVVLSGFDEFNGSATINFYENKLDMTINFEGTIFGELYVFTRVEDALE